MATFISTIVSMFVIIPFLGYFLTFITAKELLKNHRKAVHVATDITTFLLILSVHFIIISIWEKSFLWVILISIFMVGIIFTVVHWKAKGEIHFKKVFKGFWRVNFLLFSTAYISLLVVGLILRLVKII